MAPSVLPELSCRCFSECAADDTCPSGVWYGPSSRNERAAKTRRASTMKRFRGPVVRIMACLAAGIDRQGWVFAKAEGLWCGIERQSPVHVSRDSFALSQTTPRRAWCHVRTTADKLVGTWLHRPPMLKTDLPTSPHLLTSEDARSRRRACERQHAAEAVARYPVG
jgi:hypothetical protein